MGAAPPSPARKAALIAAGGTLLFWTLFLAIPAFVRPPPMLFSVAALFLALIVTVGWPIAACALALSRQWRPVLLAALFFIVPLAGSMSPLGIDRTLEKSAQRLEFVIYRSSYDAIVEKTPKTDAPRLIRVSYRDVSGECCGTPLFEEIWFDEGDDLASPDAAVRDHRFQSSHPWRPDQTRRSIYQIRPLGGHYYFIDIRN